MPKRILHLINLEKIRFTKLQCREQVNIFLGKGRSRKKIHIPKIKCAILLENGLPILLENGLELSMEVNKINQ